MIRQMADDSRRVTVGSRKRRNPSTEPSARACLPLPRPEISASPKVPALPMRAPSRARSPGSRPPARKKGRVVAANEIKIGGRPAVNAGNAPSGPDFFDNRLIRVAGIFRNRAKRDLAEGVGFEPTIRGVPYTRFPSVRLQPLGHPSMQRIMPEPLRPGKGKATKRRSQESRMPVSQGRIALAQPRAAGGSRDPLGKTGRLRRFASRRGSSKRVGPSSGGIAQPQRGGDKPAVDRVSCGEG